MGCRLALALAFLLPAGSRSPARPRGRHDVVFLLAIGACFTLWFGAIVGVLVTSWRAVG
jgi:hypothetical protein